MKTRRRTEPTTPTSIPLSRLAPPREVRRAPWWALLAIAFAAAVSLWSLSYRYAVETGNRAVTLVAEVDVVESLAASQGVPIGRAVENLRAQGLGALVLSEETLGGLIADGRVDLFTTAEAGPTLFFRVPGDLERVERGLGIRFGDPTMFRRDEGSIRVSPTIAPQIRGVTIGLNPRHVRIATDRNLQIVGRYGNPTGASERTVRETLRWASEQGVRYYLPQGEQVLGRRDAIDTTLESLERFDLLYATPEFVRIGGDATILARAPERVVRLHSAQAAELDRLSRAGAVERYVRAARERNMRMLLLRPTSAAAEAPSSDFAAFVREVNHGMAQHGNVAGPARPFTAPEPPLLAFLLLGAALVPVGAFVLWATPLPRAARWAGLAVLVLLAVGSATHGGREVAALAAAVLFPVAGFLLLDAFRPRFALFGFLLVSAVSVVGGLFLAGLLNGLPYLIKADVFPGVKLAVFLPILLVGAYFVWRLADLRETLASPITWGASALGVVLLGALAFMLARTGNEAATVGGGEMAFRSLLDQALYVRPRTKEFLIGHPLLFLGAGLLAHHARNGRGPAGFWIALALTLGAIGQTSIVNTLQHLHTPVSLSLARIGVGLLLGCIIGLGVWAAAKRFVLRTEL
jgi:hypothetical protein